MTDVFIASIFVIALGLVLVSVAVRDMVRGTEEYRTILMAACGGMCVSSGFSVMVVVVLMN